MFTQMRMLFGHHRSWMGGGNSDVPQDEAVLTLRNVLEFATILGARAVGLQDQIGTLTPGKQADIVLIRATDLNLAPVLDPVAAAVLAAHEGNVDTVLIAGRPVKSGGRLIHVDTADIIGAARESQQAITLRRRAA
jgi:5-methylthioadenosine/S-adenosylhomocysteine deaminase